MLDRVLNKGNSVKKVNSKEVINGVKMNLGPLKKKKRNAILVNYVAGEITYIYVIMGLLSNAVWV